MVYEMPATFKKSLLHSHFHYTTIQHLRCAEKMTPCWKYSQLVGKRNLNPCFISSHCWRNSRVCVCAHVFVESVLKSSSSVNESFLSLSASLPVSLFAVQNEMREKDWENLLLSNVPVLSHEWSLAVCHCVSLTFPNNISPGSMKLCSKSVTLQDICKTREREKQSRRQNAAQDNKNDRNGNKRPADTVKLIHKLCMLLLTAYSEVLLFLNVWNSIMQC